MKLMTKPPKGKKGTSDNIAQTATCSTDEFEMVIERIGRKDKKD